LRFPPLTTRRLALAIAAGVVLLDQSTKWVAVRSLADGPVPLIDGFLQFRLVENPGSAFSLLRGGGPVLAVIAMAAVVFIVFVAGRLSSSAEASAMGLVLGGAVGNLVDRVFRAEGFLDGRVIDFIDFDFFPTFNAADSAITIGAILAVLLALLRR
jgi:signal peptidase II